MRAYWTLGVLAALWLAGEARASGELVYPQEGRVRDIGFFGAGRTGGRHHKGLDIAGPLGSSITAARGGTVTFSGRTDPRGYGTLVEVSHGNGYETRYAHMRTLSVRSGQSIRAGQQVGLEGVEGNARGTEPHVHFEVRRWGVAQYIPGRAFQRIHRNSPIPQTYALPAMGNPPSSNVILRAWINRQTEYVNVRTAPGMHGKILGQIKTERLVVSSDASGDWLKIHYKGLDGWIWKNALEPAGKLRAFVLDTNCLFRASSEGKPVGQAHRGEIYPIHGEQGTAYEIDWGDIHYSYIRKTYGHVVSTR